MEEEKIRKHVRKTYGEIAKRGTSSCCSQDSSCGCRGTAVDAAQSMGYSIEELEHVPARAIMGLGCGNPLAFASLREGETVLDLGSGGGLDCFLAARRVGKKGKVIGVDMTPAMVDRARENARKGGYSNVEFRLGEIENLPVADGSVDVVVSNCVINLSPDKKRVFEEAFRVLKPGGRLAISDIVLREELPSAIKRSVKAYVACVAGAMLKEDYLRTIEAAGFRDVEVMEETSYPLEIVTGKGGTSKMSRKNSSCKEKSKEKDASPVISIKIRASKPSK